MALVQCGDCGNEVSDKAPACPKCGNPIATAQAGTSVQAIEQTAKRFKLQSIMAFLVFCGGAWAMGYGADASTRQTGVMIVLVAFVWYVSNRIRQWWHHG